MKDKTFILVKKRENKFKDLFNLKFKFKKKRKFVQTFY